MYRGIYTLVCFFLKQNTNSRSQSFEYIKNSTPSFVLSLSKTRVLSANPSNVSRILHFGFPFPSTKQGFLKPIREMYQGFYILVCLFPKQNMGSFGQSVECMKDSTPWLAFTLSKTWFFSANPSNVSRILHPGLPFA